MTHKIIILIVLSINLTGCEIDSTSYETEPWQEKMVEDLTAKEWIRSYKKYIDKQEIDEQEIVKLNKDGSGYWISYSSNNNQPPIEHRGYFKWTFTNPAYEYIYRDNRSYWKIKKLTSDSLCVYESHQDPDKVPNPTNKKYKAFAIRE